MLIDLYYPIMDGPEEPSPAVLLERMRYERDGLLAGSDFRMLPDVDCDKEAWAAYREELRRAPDVWVPGPVWDAPDPPST